MNPGESSSSSSSSRSLMPQMPSMEIKERIEFRGLAMRCGTRDSTRTGRKVIDWEDARDKLATLGMVVVPGVVRDPALKRKGIFQVMEQLTAETDIRFKTGDTGTWQGWDRVMPEKVQMAGHAQALWDIRQDPRVVGCFAHMMRCSKSDLLSNYDGFSVVLPHEVTGREQVTEPGFRVCGEGPDKSVQGLVNLKDVAPGDSTFRCILGSHLFEKAFAKEFPKARRGDVLTHQQVAWYESLEERLVTVSVLMEAGDVLIWDPRLVHCRAPARKWRAKMNLRVWAHLSMVPRHASPPDRIRRKRKFFEELQMTTEKHHKVARRRKEGTAQPALEKMETVAKSFPRPELTHLGLHLSGH
mgnify:CR=1 FL=1